VSRLDHRLEPEGEVRRFEVITGALGRRRWNADDRARIVEESLLPGAVVWAVARRHELTPQQLFTWRREARRTAVTIYEEISSMMNQPSRTEQC
jgi:transposase